ncbi:hypothetical protein GSI_12888 [Ganoderma sinense ZZ0214-1]|uniref:Uncharacterized protein n=1 Tax=Ganoderma sinense ZZ0214-1 TaxID=1077348 RepID=A0A2G8RU16_9APHY|nr:hypothetical protein GSI_12888 [Ganoderma sinense ZZ0214-1]
MDDLYQNAWSETTTNVTPTFNPDPRPSWSSPSKVTSPYDEEADLAAPSWSTGAGIQWDEPSGSPGISWSLADGDAGWGPSTYEGITLGKSPVDVVPQRIREPPENAVLDAVKETSPTAIQEVNDYVALAPSPDKPPSSLPSSPVQASSPEPSLSPASPKAPLPPTVSTSVPEPVVVPSYDIVPELAAPPSPDGFGTFESGLAEEAPGFGVNDADADPWGASAWADTKQEEDDDEPVVDEWERAKQEKAKQDRRVPPELLAQILSQSEELSYEISPDPREREEISEKDAWRNDRRSGMEGVPGLSTFSDTFLPPLSLQPLVRFSQARVAKKMASSVKLTKNLPITRGSPMSHYLAAKGSTAWEISVKERKEVVEDDVPVGWRIVEKAPSVPTADAAKDKKSGGLFSFWGRRQSQVPTAASTVLGTDASSRPTSMDKPESPIGSELKAESKLRASQDSVRSSATSSVAQLPSPLTEPSPVMPSPITSMSSYSSAPDPVISRLATPPPPSAVSRFLNRFSRRGGGASTRSSLALSSDDLEFLSDIVPSANDDAEDDPADDLEKFVSRKHEAVVPVLPPPLAPPPKAPPLRPISAASSSSGPGSKLNSPAASAASDLDGLFGSFGSGGATSAPPGASRPTLPSLGTPFELVWSNAPSSAPGVGPSKLPFAPTSSQPSSRPISPLQAKSPPLSSFALPPPPSFKPITPSVVPKSKPTLSSPFARPLIVGQVEPGPMSASSTSSRTSYQTAGESEPPSPSSALPLGELYPHLVTPSSTPQRSASERKGPSLPSSSFESETPMATTFSRSSFSASILRAPFQAHSAKSPTAIPLTSNLFDDDDDFSDFQSPVEQGSHVSPPVPPPIAKSPRTLAAANAAHAKLRNSPSRSQTLPTLSPYALSPPPTSSLGAAAAPLKPSLTTFDDDDFADFRSTSLSSLSPPSSSSTSLFSNSTSDKALLTPRHIPSSVSGFDDSFGSMLATPSPPRLPAKSTIASQPPRLDRPTKAVPALQPPPLQPPPGQSVRAVPPLQPPPQSQIVHSPSTVTPISPTNGPNSATTLLTRRRSHAAEHKHTLSLLELAATKSGQRWPAPASPLPAAIPGLDGAPSKLFNIMDDEDPPAPTTVAAQPPSGSGFLPPPSTSNLNPIRPSSGLGMIGSRSAAPSPAPAPPFAGLAPMHTGSSVSSAGASAPTLDPLFDTWDFGRSTTPLSAPNGTANGSAFGVGGTAKPATNGKKAGGLSAQDLSFFEGL